MDGWEIAFYLPGLVWSVTDRPVHQSLTLTVMFMRVKQHVRLKTYKWLRRQQIIIFIIVLLIF